MAMSEAGWVALGIDWQGNKDVPVIDRTVHIDLSTDAGQAAFWQIVKERRPVYIHFGPPCGTASRARERRLKNGHDPLPLRSDAEPDGISSLAGQDKERVIAANTLYWFVAGACRELTKLEIAWSIENSKNSLFWKTSWVRYLIEKVPQCREIHFQHCMHGGTRDKRTMLLVSRPGLLDELAILCDGKHTHAPWGKVGNKFATAQERNYPALLCRRWASSASKFFAVEKRSLATQIVVRQQAKGLPDDKLQKVYRELQPRKGLGCNS